MTQQKTTDVIRQLAIDITHINETARAFYDLSAEQLREQPGPDQWSIAQCLEHLNTYSRYYLPRIDAALSKAGTQRSASTPLFSSSWLGTYFVNMMQPGEAGKPAKRYKAARQHQPAAHLDPHQVLSEFQQQQTRLLALLQRAETVNLRRITIPLSIAGWLSLNLGDVLRFLVVHQQRHIAQALRVQLSQVSSHPATPTR